MNCEINNSINENKFNNIKHQSNNKKMHRQVKKLLKPLLAFLLKKNNKNTYKKSAQPQYFDDDDQTEIDDNLANELLENEIFEEIDCCEENSGVSVYRNGHMDIVPVFRGERYIPVHFARTEAGTFFWTSMVGADCDVISQGDRDPITGHQEPELQVPAPCRWAQA